MQESLTTGLEKGRLFYNESFDRYIINQLVRKGGCSRPDTRCAAHFEETDVECFFGKKHKEHNPVLEMQSPVQNLGPREISTRIEII